MRCFLIGSKELSVKVLEELVRTGHNVLGVLTRDHEDGMKVWLEELGHRSLKLRAEELDVAVYEKISINSEEMIKILSDMDLDILFSVFWGEIVKQPVLNLPRLGCFNLHTAYLPNNRGSFPLAWAIINGEPFAGLTIHKMFPGVDDGHIVAQVKVPIEGDETGESLYNKVTEAGFYLFRETLPKFVDLTYTLMPQNLSQGSYHPRGYPYGRQINPHWDSRKITRFKNALHFPPFRSFSPTPPRLLSSSTGPNVRIMLGFDCDRPRGALIASIQGSEMAERKISSIERISRDLEELGIPRTFFICGLFLKSMSYKFGSEHLRQAFAVDSPLVELGDHSYSHSILKKIEIRPDKSPISPQQAVEEYRINTKLFKDIFEKDIPSRGYRAPLGHFNGLHGEYVLLDKMVRAGVKYVSSDLRDQNHSLKPPLQHQDGTPRQPYRYENGLLEIPSMGWQDTLFSGTSRTPVFGGVPNSYDQIVDYYRRLFEDAKAIASEYDRDFFLGLVLHPYDITHYDVNGRLFCDLYAIAMELGGSFCTYEDVFNHFEKCTPFE
jgi:methionyl-tRNA formyltransferase